MNDARYDVVIVGAGCAGLTAAIGLARAGFAVTVVEATPVVGGANGLGDVCFADSLIQPDMLGAEGVEALAWERRLIERGSFVTDGRRIAGSMYRDPDAFRHCYTVVRPRFDPQLAQVALHHGVDLRTETTVERLIRQRRRVIGVVTSHGALYARLVFLAEGDAGHLVSREGLDRSSDPPTFWYTLEQSIDLPPGAIEERFRVGPEQGVAYDFLLRNPAQTRYNARGSLLTHRQGVTLRVVLPAQHMRRQRRGEPKHLLDWFVDMPALKPWLHDGRRGAWSAALVRIGGLRNVPYLVEDGLVIGGAAAGLSVDFPSLDVLGPATMTGLCLSRAAARIRDKGGDFDRASLGRNYLEPLQQSHYWRNMAFLQRWPGYERKTYLLFDDALDLALDSAAVWAKSRRWLPRKLLGWLRILGRVSWLRWDELRAELVHLGRALRLREVTPRPAAARILLDGALNAFRDLVRRPRPHLPPSGKLRLYYHATDEQARASAVPWLLHRWFARFRPVLASVGRLLYVNDDTPLPTKLTRIIELLVRQINLLDLIAAAVLAAALVLLSTVFSVTGNLFPGRRRAQKLTSEPTKTTPEVASDSTSGLTPAVRLHVIWRSTVPAQQAEAVRDLPYICPTGVFTVRGAPPGTVQVQVQAEKCIACEACWRLNPHVDWARAEAISQENAAIAHAENRALMRLCDQFEHKILEFDHALRKRPALVDRARGDHLEMLARDALRLALQIRENLELMTGGKVGKEVLDLADDLVAQAEKRTRRTWDGRFAWAAADGLLLRQHYLLRLRRLLGLGSLHHAAIAEDSTALGTDWIPGPLIAAAPKEAWLKHRLADLAARHYLLETLEQVQQTTRQPTQNEICKALIAGVRQGLELDAAQLDKLAAGQETAFDSRPTMPEVYQQQGPLLLADAELLRKVLDVPGDWATLSQRGALGDERQEIAAVEDRLTALTTEAKTADIQSSLAKQLSAEFARQVAHLLGAKFLLWRTFARLEVGQDAELAIVLLRVWLDMVVAELDEYTIRRRQTLQPPPREWDRPLVEPGSAAPVQTVAEYIAATIAYTSGDFLFVPVDLRQPRFVPEMLGGKDFTALPDLLSSPSDVRIMDLLHALKEIRASHEFMLCSQEMLYLAETLAIEMAGRCARISADSLTLELACTRLLFAEVRAEGGAVRQRCVILQTLAQDVLPRWMSVGPASGVHHLERHVLELEALKADFRRHLLAVWQMFGAALAQNADVQVSCLTLAETAAWIKAADSILARMAWLEGMSQVEEREDFAQRQELGRRTLRLCIAAIRNHLFHVEEDLAALRRGYYDPHVRAANLLLDAIDCDAAQFRENPQPAQSFFTSGT